MVGCQTVFLVLTCLLEHSFLCNVPELLYDLNTLDGHGLSHFQVKQNSARESCSSPCRF